MAGRRAKLTKICPSMVSTWCVQVIFDNEMLNVILMSVGAFPIFDNLYLENTYPGAKRSEIWNPRTLVQYIWGTFCA